MAKPEGPPDIVPVENWRTDAISDKGFADVLAASVGVVGSKLDIGIFTGCLFIGTVGVIIARTQFDQLIMPSVTAQMVQQWSSFGAGVSVAILGFLIAGFSVFATVTRPAFFHVLAQIRQSNRNISEFKFVFYNFIYIFAHYIIYLAMCMLFASMLIDNSPAWFAGKVIYAHAPILVDILLGIMGAMVISYSVFSLLLLRSFLWNLYQSLLFAIFYEEPEAKEKVT